MTQWRDKSGNVNHLTPLASDSEYCESNALKMVWILITFDWDDILTKMRLITLGFRSDLVHCGQG